MPTYCIKNWDHFQHYRDRNPPWIKLHYELLSSSDWVMLDDPSRVLAIACMLVASRSKGANGEIDGSDSGLAYLKRVAYLNKSPNLKPLIQCGFLVLASSCKQVQADAISETETETETETEPPISPKGDDGFANFWQAYQHKKSKGKAEKAWKKINPSDELQATILAAIPALHASKNWTKDNGEWRQHPATWLNAKGWEDEESTSPTTTPDPDEIHYRFNKDGTLETLTRRELDAEQEALRAIEQGPQ